MSYNFSEELELQVRKEVRRILSTLTYGYEFEMSDYATSSEEEEQIERRGKREVKKAEDKLVSLALSMY